MTGSVHSGVFRERYCGHRGFAVCGRCGIAFVEGDKIRKGKAVFESLSSKVLGGYANLSFKSFFGSKKPLRSFRRGFLGCFCMDFSHALGSAVLAVVDVGYGLLVLPFVNVNETLECAFCDGNK